MKNRERFVQKPVEKMVEFRQKSMLIFQLILFLPDGRFKYLKKSELIRWKSDKLFLAHFEN